MHQYGYSYVYFGSYAGLHVLLRSKDQFDLFTASSLTFIECFKCTLE